LPNLVFNISNVLFVIDRIIGHEYQYTNIYAHGEIYCKIKQK